MLLLRPRTKGRGESYKRWRKNKARRIRVESDVVLPRDLLYSLAEENPKTQAKFEQILQSVPWRLEKFGDEIFNLLKASR